MKTDPRAADLKAVAISQFMPRDPAVIHRRAVAAVQINQHPAAILRLQATMLARSEDVVNADITVRRSADHECAVQGIAPQIPSVGAMKGDVGHKRSPPR